LRVAFLVSHFPVISETFILDQVTGLLDRGCEVTIFADEPAPSPAVHPEVAAYDLAAITRFPPMPADRLARPFRALALAAADPGAIRAPHLRSLNVARYGIRSLCLRLFFETVLCAKYPPFEVIHCHFGPNGIKGLALRDIGALRGRLVTSFYGHDVSEHIQSHSRNPYVELFAKADLSIAISEVMRGRLIGLGCPADKLRVHRLGVDPALFRRAVRAEGRPLRILTVGRMVPKKGHEFGLRAVAEAAAAMPEIEYVVAGDGPLRPQIEQMVRDLGLQTRVKLAGWKTRPEIVAAMSEADILLAPSVTAANGDREGTPVAILEAMASGLPVVSTDHAGIPEMVEDGVSGFLSPERDVPGLAKALTLLAGDSGLRAGMGERGRAIVEKQYDIRSLNDELLRIYREITRSSRT
jgi:colanic acid/amylovoran biosynthesis glycosyltransferase